MLKQNDQNRSRNAMGKKSWADWQMNMRSLRPSWITPTNGKWGGKKKKNPKLMSIHYHFWSSQKPEESNTNLQSICGCNGRPSSTKPKPSKISQSRTARGRKRSEKAFVHSGWKSHPPCGWLFFKSSCAHGRINRTGRNNFHATKPLPRSSTRATRRT